MCKKKKDKGKLDFNSISWDGKDYWRNKFRERSGQFVDMLRRRCLLHIQVKSRRQFVKLEVKR